ncbi:MAG: type IX secretion system sortase PorU [Bacteroidales bacterium]|nr:type IX secretion system sortase PorU [Bacteroidales bacterium]
MKILYSLCFFLFAYIGLSANNSRTLEWFHDAASGKSVPDFVGSIRSGETTLPMYSETQRPATVADAFSATLIYPVYEELSSAEVRQLKPLLKDVSDSIKVKVSTGIERKKQILDLSFFPFIKKGNTFYKLISFDWNIKPVKSALRVASGLLSAADYATSSVLSSGVWKKISVSETGLYKLTYSDIKAMGINPDKVQIYGYGGGLLEEDFSLAGYMDDLPEVAVWKELGKDQVFNAGDYILFYAKGPVSWKYDKSFAIYSRVRNHYSNKAYYFVGERAGGTKTVSKSTYSGTSNKEISSFTDFLLHETDRVNIGESASGSGTGRQLYGEDFTTSAIQSFSFEVSNPDTNQVSKAQVEFIARNTGNSTCGIYVDGTRLSTLSMAQVSTTGDSYIYASSSNKVFAFTPKSDKVTVRLEYAKNGSATTHRACLNYIILNVRRLLRMTGSVMAFQDPTSVGEGNVGHFTIQDASANMVVLDVTNPQEMVQVNGQPNGTTYDFTAPTSTLHEYLCVNLDGVIAKPTIEGNVLNQNIHGQPQVDMVIIAPSEFTSYANTLKQAHQIYDHLNVMVVTPEQVYNEFSSGTPDATAYRRMMKFFYDREELDENLPDYLLLFGDGVYDNRLVSTMFSQSSSKPNKILTYQSVESLNGLNSYVSDDYFGFLDNNEGAKLQADKLDIGIGRFPVASAEQAKAAVDKTISYMENKKRGAWKNRLLYLADDGNDYTHEIQSYSLASSVEKDHPEFMINKIYLDAYPRVTSASGVTVPDANKRFSELLNAGLLMLNYTGHGSTTQWADEKLLTMQDIKSMTNKYLPLWVTATCDFTRYDAFDTSGGEEVFLNANGGGIALLTTTRVVYSYNNDLLNKSFSDSLFAKKKSGIRYALGDIMKIAKSSEVLKNDLNKLKFTLIGDPALKLGYPEYFANVTQVNGIDVSEKMDTLQAMSQVTISGQVYREDNSLATDFNGLLYPTVFDAEEIYLQFTRNEGESARTYYDRNKILFSGKDSVVNGCFSFTFVVPKDISYSGKTGSINLYACDNDGGHEAQGNFEQFILGGTDMTANIDHSGPDIKLFLNDNSFHAGDEVNETPTLIALISDENGLNTSGNGIGHDLMLVIDDDPSMTYNLNNYFTADIGSYASGTVQYVLPELTAGKHHLSLKAWDVQNNSNADTLWFVVKPGMSPSVSNLKYAQRGETAWFVFNHDRPDANVSLKLVVYDLFGRMIWYTDSNMLVSENVSETIAWNLTDTNGRRISEGIYICKIWMTDSNGAQTSGSKKIRVSAQ